MKTEEPEDKLQLEFEKFDGNNRNFELNSFSAFFDKNANNDSNYNKWEDWENLVENEYNIHLVINSEFEAFQKRVIGNPQYTSSEFKYLKRRIEGGELRGLIQIKDNLLLQKLIDENLILSINQFLMKIDNYIKFSEQWKNAFNLKNETWALPLYYKETVPIRLIRKDWLTNLKTNKSSIIIEFQEVLYNFTYNDPDEYSLDNTIGSVHFGIEGIEDIFSSFDARLTPNGLPGPVCNPNSNLFEDSIIKPEFKECLEFISYYDDGKFMLNSTESSQESFYDGFSGSYFSSISDNIFSYSSDNKYRYMDDEIDYIVGLIHNISLNITSITTLYSSPIVLTKSSEYPENTINIFVDFFLSNLDGYLFGRKYISQWQ